MSRHQPLPMHTLLRSLQQAGRPRAPHPRRTVAAPAASRPAAATAGFATSARRPEKQDFRAQLNESVQARLQRERKEQARFSEARGSEGNSGRPAALTFLLFAVAATSYYIGTWGLGSKASIPTTSTTPLESAFPPQHNLDEKNLQAAWADLVTIVGEENVSTDEGNLGSHSESTWSTYQNQPGEIPFMVVSPTSTEEVSKIMKVCHERRIPVIGFSGGTSLEGHFAATRKGVCVDFGRMNRIIDLHAEDLDVIVQPAVGWEDLNEMLGEKGLFFPPDPGPGAQIGGMVGTGCSGTNAYRYGTMRDWVLSLTVVLADGTVIKTKQRPRKSSAGYDLTRMFIGSEGTLGLVTEATLKLTTKPQSTSVAVCAFDTIHDAARCVERVVGQGVPIAAVELLDDEQMRVINEAGATSRNWKEAPTLFFKFAGTPKMVGEQVEIVKKVAKASQSTAFEFAKSADEQAELWSARKEALWSVMGQKRDGDHVWTTDVAVPMTRLPDVVKATKEDMKASGLLATIVGHVGDGNFHAIILFNEEQRAVAEGVVHRMVKLAVENEGTVTGEHGVGLIKRDYLEHELDRPTVDAMRRLKQAFDPLCLLNCDKVVRVEQPKPGEIKPW